MLSQGALALWRCRQVLRLGKAASWSVQERSTAVTAAVGILSRRVLWEVASFCLVCSVGMVVLREPTAAVAWVAATAMWVAPAVLRPRVSDLLATVATPALTMRLGRPALVLRTVAEVATGFTLLGSVFLPEAPSPTWALVLGLVAAVAVAAAGGAWWLGMWRPTQGPGAPLIWRSSMGPVAADRSATATEHAAPPGRSDDRAQDDGLDGPFVTRRSRERRRRPDEA